jgi:dephospho-CoA kinase
LAKKNIPVIDADRIARRVVYKDSLVYHKLVAVFGKGIVDEKRLIDRKALANRAFSLQNGVDTLNQITHPEIIRRIRARLNYWTRKKSKFVILDVPLLFESRLDFLCDYVIAVDASEECRLKRVLLRDRISKEDALLRFGVQQKSDYYSISADFVILNNNSLENLEIQAEKIFTEIEGDISDKNGKN